MLERDGTGQARHRLDNGVTHAAGPGQNNVILYMRVVPRLDVMAQFLEVLLHKLCNELVNGIDFHSIFHI